MSVSLFQQWQPAFLQQVQDPSTATPLKDAAINAQLAAWTTCLTTAVVRSCESLGWQAAGKGHPLALLPQAGQEYLGIDVMAFAGTPSVRWPFPIAAFELENHAKDDRVAYSLWKVLCLRVGLRVVFALTAIADDQHRLPLQSRPLLRLHIADHVLPDGVDQLPAPFPILPIGETFPWSYFKFWMLDANLGRFEKI